MFVAENLLLLLVISLTGYIHHLTHFVRSILVTYFASFRFRPTGYLKPVAKVVSNFSTQEQSYATVDRSLLVQPMIHVDIAMSHS